MSENKTTIPVRSDVRDRLKDLKPYDSMSYDDLLRDMAETYAGGGGR